MIPHPSEVAKSIYRKKMRRSFALAILTMGLALLAIWFAYFLNSPSSAPVH